MREGREPLNQAEVAGVLSGYFGVPADHAGVVKLVGLMMPDMQIAADRHPQSWKTGLPGMIARYEGAARELGLGVSQTQRDADILRRSNETDATFAAALGRLEAAGLGGGNVRRASSEAYRELPGSGTSEKAGLSKAEYAGLEGQFGKEAVALAVQQAGILGLQGKQNVALLSEFKDVAGALASGNMDQAWALYNSEKDPEKQKKILTLIQAAIDAKNKNNKELQDATKSLPPADAARVRKTVESYAKNSQDPKAREAFERLQTQYKDNKAVSKALHKTKDDNDRLAKTKAEQDGKNKRKTDENAVTAKRANEKEEKGDALLASLSDRSPAPATEQKASGAKSQKPRPHRAAVSSPG